MSSLITAEVANRYISHQLLSLGLFDAMEDQAAEILATYSGTSLIFRSLTELSPRAALSLAGFKGEKLILNSYNDLSFEVAESLSHFTGMLDLSGIIEFKSQSAKGLSDFRGLLKLNGITHLSIEDAEVLSTFKCHQLELSGIKDLQGDAALAISAYGGCLDLSSIQEMSLEAAKGLSNHRGELVLKGIRVLTEPAAQYLSYHEGRLVMYSINDLPDTDGHADLAGSLSSHPGDVHLPELRQLHQNIAYRLSFLNGCLAFDALDSMDDETAARLSLHKGGISLPRLKSLHDTPGHVALSEKIASYNDHISLDGLEYIGDSAAEKLSTFKGEGLLLPKLKHLNDTPGHFALAYTLAKRNRSIRMDELERLSDRLAEIFSAFRGKEFSMSKVKDFPDTQGYVKLLVQLLANDELGYLRLGIHNAGDHCKSLLACFYLLGKHEQYKITLPEYVRKNT